MKFHLPDASVTEIKHEGTLSYTCGDGFETVLDEETKAFPYIECNGGIWEGDSPDCKG